MQFWKCSFHQVYLQDRLSVRRNVEKVVRKKGRRCKGWVFSCQWLNCLYLDWWKRFFDNKATQRIDAEAVNRRMFVCGRVFWSR